MGRGSSTTVGAELFYGESLRSNRNRGPSLASRDWPDSLVSAAAITFNSPKRYIQPNQLYQYGIAPELLQEVPTIRLNPQELEELIEGFVKKQNPLAKRYLKHAKCVSGPKHQTSVLLIEELPEYKEARAISKRKDKTPVRKYGEHLGVAHYVYDPSVDKWLLIARHGRGIYDAGTRPYSSFKEAAKRQAKLEQELWDGSYEVDQQYAVTKKARQPSLELFEQAVQAQK